jgi:hypothetical protein
METCDFCGAATKLFVVLGAPTYALCERCIQANGLIVLRPWTDDDEVARLVARAEEE